MRDRITRRRVIAGAGALTLTTLLAGCGGGEDGGGGEGGGGGGAEGGSPTTTATATASPSPTAGDSTGTEATTTSAETDTETETEAETTTSEETATETSTETTDGGGSEDVEVADGLELLEHELYVDDEFSGGVRGEVENTSGGTLGYVAAEAKFINDEGTRIGEGLANTTDLPDGETWAFDCLYTGSEDANNIDDYTLTVTDSAL